MCVIVWGKFWKHTNNNFTRIHKRTFRVRIDLKNLVIKLKVFLCALDCILAVAIWLNQHTYIDFTR